MANIANRKVWRPAHPNPSPDSLRVNTSGFCPVGSDHCFAVALNDNITSRVRVLLYVSRPPTVSRLIVAIVVDAVDGMKRAWLRPHVGKKVLKRLKPSLAYANASVEIISLVPFVFSILRTPIQHAAPCGVFCLPTHAVFCASNGVDFASEAPTRLGVSTAKIPSSNHDGAAAIARTSPCVRFIFVSGEFDDRERPKLHRNHVDEAAVDVRIGISHDVTFLKKVAERLEPHAGVNLLAA